MSTFINLLSDSTFAEKMDTQNALLSVLARSDTFKFESWAQLQGLVRSGLASKILSIGDQFVCQKEGEAIAWDVIGIDCETIDANVFRHSITLQLHNPIGFLIHTLTQALYYCEKALPAGTYHFYLYNYLTPSESDLSQGVNQYYSFTLTKSVPAKGHILFPMGITSTALSTKISTYDSVTSTEAIETVSVKQGQEGTLLPSDKIACAEKIRYGYNSYKNSQIRTFLNSNYAAGSIFRKGVTNFEHFASWPFPNNGFMYGMDEDFLAVLYPVKKKTKTNTVMSDGSYEVTEDIFFLPSASEVFGTPIEGEEGEGAPYPYYSSFCTSPEPHDLPDKGRTKYKKDGSVASWMLRTAVSDTVHYCKIIGAKGNVPNNPASFSANIAPLCVIA
ncbi:MAG: hypothetical protein J6K61_04920 [Clostridia bacterium]|nr:hypothetical protein [Clostridia bacterium]